MAIEIQKYPPMTPTRPCKYCLALQGGSVFADFDVDGSGCLYLIRISFDGYDCCGIDGDIRKLNNEESRKLIDWIESNNVNHDEMKSILLGFLHDNNDVIWPDALQAHELLKTT